MKPATDLTAHTSAVIDPLVDTCGDVAGPLVVAAPAATLAYLRLDRALEAQGIFVVRVDTVPVVGASDLLHALYLNAAFPGYFGFNWDALADCLSDFSWRPASGYVLIVQHPETIDPHAWSQFLDVLNQARQVWQREGCPVKLVVPKP